MTVPPLVVATSAVEAQAALTVLAAQGWRLLSGFRSSSSAGAPARIVCSGEVADAAAAGEALLAAVSGAGIVAVLDAPVDVAWRFLDDLSRVGPVLDPTAVIDGDADGDAGLTAGSALDADARRLLERLAAGDTVSAAAREVGMSRRTATRRLAEVRASLGVASNAAAVVAYGRLRAAR